jgi:hypothetical protein
MSHSMTPEQRNYPIADKEMLAIILALEQWHHHLEGARHSFEIWTDHKNLQYFMKSQDLNCRQARWAQYLSRFDYLLINKPGTLMGKADALSRREDHAVGIEKDNKETVFIPSSRVCYVYR